MSEWQEVSLSEVAPYWTGKVEVQDLNEENFISADNMLPDKGGIVNSVYAPTAGKSTSFKPKDILVSNIRPYFKKIWFADKIGGCSNDVIVFRSINLVDSRFIYYCLSNDNFFDYMMAGANGTKMPRGNKKSIPKYKISLPPLPTQQKIAKILSNYDDLIENNLKRIKLLEESARLTYEEWFLRFRIDGKKLEIDPESGLPFGWEYSKNGNVCGVSGGGTPSKAKDEYWHNGSINWFSPTDLSKAKSLCVLGSKTKTNKLGISKSSAKLLSSNSFMMSSRATIGLFGLIEDNFSTNQGFINITPHRVEDKYYLLHNLMSRVQEFKNYATGATFPEISKGKFKPLPIVWPEESVIDNFNDICTPIYSEIFNLTNQSQLLKEARDMLLPRLMTGMIDTNDMDIAI